MDSMSRRFLAAIVCLSTTVGLLLGLVIAGSLTPAPAVSAPKTRVVPARSASSAAAAPALASFADIAERLNPAVVNIDSTSRGDGSTTKRLPFSDLFDRSNPFSTPFDRQPDRNPEDLRRGAGTGFLIDAEGHILTNQHVVEPADRITVRLADGRSLRAKRIGIDPDTDIALIKVDSPEPLPFAPLGDSDALRVGEWVVAIGNPLAYEHTVTVGIVSYMGRKLFNRSLDRYIQTDAAINLGNSGGPLINTQGEVVGINSALSAKAANIGFAVPINQATAVLTQLMEKGRVSRGYIGVGPRDVDPDLQHSLRLRTSHGALVQDVTKGAPGERAGVRPYDLIVAVDGKAVTDSDALIQLIAAKPPGTTATLQVLRDDRPLSIPVKLAERPRMQASVGPSEPAGRPQPSVWKGPALGLSVRDLDREFAERSRLPDGLQGVIVSKVESLSPAYDAALERDDVLLEINRQAVHSVSDYRRLIGQARPGDILTFYVYSRAAMQKVLRTVRLD